MCAREFILFYRMNYTKEEIIMITKSKTVRLMTCLPIYSWFGTLVRL